MGTLGLIAFHFIFILLCYGSNSGQDKQAMYLWATCPAQYDFFIKSEESWLRRRLNWSSGCCSISGVEFDLQNLSEKLGTVTCVHNTRLGRQRQRLFGLATNLAYSHNVQAVRNLYQKIKRGCPGWGIIHSNTQVILWLHTHVQRWTRPYDLCACARTHTHMGGQCLSIGSERILENLSFTGDSFHPEWKRVSMWTHSHHCPQAAETTHSVEDLRKMNTEFGGEVSRRDLERKWVWGLEMLPGDTVGTNRNCSSHPILVPSEFWEGNCWDTLRWHFCHLHQQ